MRTIYITIDMIVKIGSIVSIVVALITMAWKLFKWINHQKEQDEAIADMRKELMDEIQSVKDIHKNDERKTEHSFEGIQEEQTLIVYGLLACLKGLKEQGCNGPVTEAVNKIEKHLNQKAHGQQ